MPESKVWGSGMLSAGAILKGLIRHPSTLDTKHQDHAAEGSGSPSKSQQLHLSFLLLASLTVKSTAYLKVACCWSFMDRYGVRQPGSSPNSVLFSLYGLKQTI